MVLKMYMARLDSILPGYSEMFKELNAFFALKNQLTNSKVTTLMWQKSSALDLWNKYSSTFPLLFPIVSYIYSIPVSSASVERLFSIARHLNSCNQQSSSAYTVEIKSFLNYNYDYVEDVISEYIHQGKH